MKRALTAVLVILMSAGCGSTGQQAAGNIPAFGIVPAASLQDSPLCGGTRPSASLVSDQEYLPQLRVLLTRASQTVDIVQFSFASESGEIKKVADTLIAMKQANPRLRVRLVMEGNYEGISERNLETREKLVQAGVLVRLDSSNRLQHAKAFCVDGRYLLLGSTNLTNSSTGQNNETNALLESPTLAKAFTSFFEKLLADPAPLYPTETHDGPVTLLSDSTYYDQVVDVIRNAHQSLDVTTYFLAYRTDQDVEVRRLLDELVRVKDRVQIRLFLEQSFGFGKEVSEANKRAAKYLAERGVTSIYFDKPSKISHAKYVVRDKEEILLGSTNWYSGDLSVNHQLNVRISDPALAQQLAEHLSDKIAREGELFNIHSR